MIFRTFKLSMSWPQRFRFRINPRESYLVFIFISSSLNALPMEIVEGVDEEMIVCVSVWFSLSLCLWNLFFFWKSSFSSCFFPFEIWIFLWIFSSLKQSIQFEMTIIIWKIYHFEKSQPIYFIFFWECLFLKSVSNLFVFFY